MEVTIVAAMSVNRVIGKDNNIPWELPSDLKRFRELTEAQVVIMGNATFNSLKRKPLKKRTNVVVTHEVNYRPNEDVYKVSSLNEVEELFSYRKNIFVIGGESIYKMAFQHMKVTKIYLTVIHEYFEGDTYFPEFDESKYRCVKSELLEENGLLFSFTEFNLIG